MQNSGMAASHHFWNRYPLFPGDWHPWAPPTLHLVRPLHPEPPPPPEVTRRSPTPPVTALEFREALRHLIALEKKMRLEMQSNLRELKLHMTQRRVDRVANKAQKLFQIRQQARPSIRGQK